MAYCEECGKKLPEGARFCPNCGHAPSPEPSKQPQPQPVQQPTRPQPSAGQTNKRASASGGGKKKGCAIGGVLVALVVIGAIIIVPGMILNKVLEKIEVVLDQGIGQMSGWLEEDTDGGLTTGPVATQPATPDGSGQTWTVLMYICGSDLESQGGYATYDLREIQEAGLTSDVNLVVEAGGTGSWQNRVFDTGYLNRSICRDGAYEVVDRQKLASMGSASTLQDFITWGAQTYPADHYMLLFWDHGGGSLYGTCIDEVFNDDMLSLQELKEAIGGAGVHFDVIGFDACLMATLETAQVLSPYADYMVASEETISGAGWEYTSWLTWLAGNTSSDASELAREICDTYMKACKWYGVDDMATLSCIDLGQMGSLSKAFDRMAADLAVATTENRTLRTVAQAAKGSEVYGDAVYNMIDLYGFIDGASSVQTESHASALLDAIDKAIVYNVKGNKRKGAHGVSVFYPLAVSKSEFDGYMQVAQSQSYAQMAAVIAGYYDRYSWEPATPIEEEEAAPITENDVNIAFTQTISDEGYLHMEITEGLDDVASVDFQMSLVIGNPDKYDLVYLGSDNNVQANWDTGVFEDNFNGMWMAIDGHYVCADIMDSRDGYNIYAIPVRINGKNMMLRASYDFDKDSYTILDAFESVDAANVAAGKSRPMREGDEVTFLFNKTSSGSDKVEEIELDTITWRDDMKMVDEDLGDGYFSYCFRITDVFGATQTTDRVIVIYEGGEIWLETMDEWAAESAQAA